MWLTFDGPHGGPLNDLGDRVLGAGEQARVRAGQRLVLESSERGAPAFFSWDFAPQAQAPRTPRRQAVAQSWGELQLGLALAARAGWRLLAALGGLAATGRRPARKRIAARPCEALPRPGRNDDRQLA